MHNHQRSSWTRGDATDARRPGLTAALTLALALALTFILAGGCTKDYCEGDGDCRPGEQCDLATNQCYATDVDAGPDTAVDAGDASPADCTGHAQCTNPDAPVCLSQTCQPCNNTSQCLDKDSTRPLCEGGRCLECTDSATHCTDLAAPICNAEGTCVACTSGSTECETPHPNEPYCVDGQCVECGQTADCTDTGEPVCDPVTHRCRACESHAECDATAGAGLGVCQPSGACVDPADFILVNADDPNCKDFATNSCDINADPCCTIAYALGKVSTTRHIILVVAASSPYDHIAVNSSQSIWLLTTTGAEIAYANAQSNIEVSNSEIVIEGFAIHHASNSLNYGVACALGADVTLLNNEIHHNDAGGVNASNCNLNMIGNTVHDNTAVGVDVSGGTLTMDSNVVHTNSGGGVYASNCTLSMNSNIVHTNSGGGIWVTNSGFTLTNNIIHSNGASTSYGGVRLSGSPTTAVFHNNTVVGNFASTSNAAGVRCDDPFDIVNSIVDGTVTPHVTAQCFPTYSYIGDESGGGSGTGNIDTVTFTDPMLDSSYKLLTGSPCIDAGDTTSAPTYDFEGDLRDASPDIGADEYHTP